MKLFIPLGVAAVAVMAGSAVAAPMLTSAPATAAAVAAAPASAAGAQDRFWDHTRWDDDGDDRRRYGAMPRPDRAALRAIGIVSVHEVERDDGRLEIEGRDARGREIDVLMDRNGRRVIAHRVDHDDDDRWDGDDRWDDRWDD